jgi:Tol biopolymer transport system component
VSSENWNIFLWLARSISSWTRLSAKMFHSKTSQRVINADGTGKQLLTHCDITHPEITESSSPGSRVDDPSWLPDGKWIIYSSSGMNTYIISSDGDGTPEKFLSGLFLVGNGGSRSLKY